MALSHSPKIVTDGLVFAYDMSNTQKSWKGAPTTNIAPNTDYANRTYYIRNDVGGFGGDDADVYYYPNGGYNNLPYKKMIKHTGGTGGSFLTDHETFTLVEGVTYKIGCWMRANRVVTLNGYALDLNRTTDNAYRTGGNPILTTEWQRITWSYICGVGEGGTYQSRQIVYTDDILPTEVYWCGFQVEANTVNTPYVNGTRTNTQAIIDLIGSSIITATSLTYANDGTFSFNGTSDRFVSPSTLFNRNDGQEITVSCWIKPSRLGGQYQIICENRSNDASIYNWILYQHINDGAISFHGDAQNKTTYIPTIGAWINVTNTVTAAGVSTLYINGVSNSVVTGYTYGNGTPGLLCVGADGNSAEAYQGAISAIQIYNRALSATEIKQNFDTLRGRYGL